MLSLGTKVYNSNKLFNSGLSGTLQHDLIERADGFAEVFPEHKYQVVEMLQQRGSLTAMTGDGRLKSARLNPVDKLRSADLVLFRCKRRTVSQEGRLRYRRRGLI